MKAKLLLYGTILACIIGLGYVSCKNSKEMIVIGTNQWIGYEPLYVARASGDLPQNEFRLVQYSSTEEVLRAYRNGVVDVVAITGDELLQLVQSVPDSRGFMVTDISAGADAVIAQGSNKSFKDLRGKKIAVEAGAVGAYMLTRALQKNEMAVTDIVPVYSLLQNHLKLFQEKSVDAVVCFEPNRTKLLSLGGMEVFSTKEIPDEIVDILVAREDLLASRSHDLKRLVSIWYGSLAKIASRSPSVIAEIAHRQGISSSDVLSSLDGITQPDSSKNLELLRSPDKLNKTLSTLHTTMISAKLISSEKTPSGIITPELFGRAQ